MLTLVNSLLAPPVTVPAPRSAPRPSTADQRVAPADEPASPRDIVTLSPEVREAGRTVTVDGETLTAEEQKQVDDLKKQDREIRTHEQAHAAAAGQYAQGGPTYEYRTGPDGRRYAVGGHVNIDTSAVPDDPQATIRKMEVVRRAALAPADPSSQDRAVAADAQQKMQRARMEMARRDEDERGPAADTPSSVGEVVDIAA